MSFWQTILFVVFRNSVVWVKRSKFTVKLSRISRLKKFENKIDKFHFSQQFLAEVCIQAQTS